MICLELVLGYVSMPEQRRNIQTATPVYHRCVRYEECSAVDTGTGMAPAWLHQLITVFGSQGTEPENGLLLEFFSRVDIKRMHLLQASSASEYLAIKLHNDIEYSKSPH